jgi:hypothetical protein
MRQPGDGVQDRGQCAAHDGSDFSVCRAIPMSTRSNTVEPPRHNLETPLHGNGTPALPRSRRKGTGPEVSGQEPASAPPADPPRRWRPIRGARHGGGHLPSARSLAFATAPSWRTFAARVPRAVNATSAPTAGGSSPRRKSVTWKENTSDPPSPGGGGVRRRAAAGSGRPDSARRTRWPGGRSGGAWQTGQSRPVRRARAARRAPRARRGRRPHRGPGSLSLA